MSDNDAGDAAFTVGSRVRLLDDSAQTGQIIDDFGVLPSVEIVIDDAVISARRWAVLCDSGHLKFVDSSELEGI